MNQKEWEEEVLISLKHQSIQDWINHSTILLRIFPKNEVKFSQGIKGIKRKSRHEFKTPDHTRLDYSQYNFVTYISRKWSTI